MQSTHPVSIAGGLVAVYAHDLRQTYVRLCQTTCMAFLRIEQHQGHADHTVVETPGRLTWLTSDFRALTCQALAVALTIGLACGVGVMLLDEPIAGLHGLVVAGAAYPAAIWLVERKSMRDLARMLSNRVPDRSAALALDPDGGDQ